MKDKRPKLQMKEKERDKKISRHKRNTQECLRSKSRIVLMNSRLENREPKNL